MEKTTTKIGHETTSPLGTKRPKLGYETTIPLGTKWPTWVRNDLGTKRPGYEMTIIRLIICLRSILIPDELSSEGGPECPWDYSTVHGGLGCPSPAFFCSLSPQQLAMLQYRGHKAFPKIACFGHPIENYQVNIRLTARGVKPALLTKQHYGIVTRGKRGGHKNTPNDSFH